MVSYKKYMYSVNVYILCMHVCISIYIYHHSGGRLIFLPGRLRLEKWNRISGIICLLISILTSIKLYYQKAAVRTDAGQMPDRCSFFNTV